MESRLRKKRKIRLKGTLLENQIYTTLDMSSVIGVPRSISGLH